MLRVGVDIGGTFTDFAAWREGDRHIFTTKVSSTPPRFAEAFKTGFEQVLSHLRPGREEPVYVMHGTTVSTNSIIERSGPAIALLTTVGFKDILELERLRLKHPLDLFATRPAPLIPRNFVFEIDERLNSNGTVRRPIDLDGVEAAARAALESGAASLAVTFLHSYRNPAHEHAARDAIRRAVGAVDISLSSDIWPRASEYERAIVCVLNAYVRRRMSDYIAEIEEYVRSRTSTGRLFITRSNGGAMAASEAAVYPVHTLLSGPASGVTAVQSLVAGMGESQFLAMDMGGTSTDISLIRDHRPIVSNAAEVGDFPLMMPVTDIEAIGAGGGSIAWVDSGALRVGPRSAGARPGPACFARGGTDPTLTDAYVLCGYLNPGNFLHGQMRLDVAAARSAMQHIADHLSLDPAAAAEACVHVATSNMVARVLPYLARQGTDPADVTLVVYGGNGAIHGPLLAAEIGVRRVLVPRIPAVFCAFGGLVSELMHDTISVVHGLPMTSKRLAGTLELLRRDAAAWLSAQAPQNLLARVSFEYWAEMRYRGQSFQTSVLLDTAAGAGDLEAAQSAFHAEHERLYTYADVSASIEFVELRVRIRGALAAPAAGDLPRAPRALEDDAVTGRRTAQLDGRAYRDVPVFDRAALSSGHRLAGPAVIEQPDATILVPPRFDARTTAVGNIVLTQAG